MRPMMKSQARLAESCCSTSSSTKRLASGPKSETSGSPTPVRWRTIDPCRCETPRSSASVRYRYCSTSCSDSNQLVCGSAPVAGALVGLCKRVLRVVDEAVRECRRRWLARVWAHRLRAHDALPLAQLVQAQAQNREARGLAQDPDDPLGRDLRRLPLRTIEPGRVGDEALGGDGDVDPEDVDGDLILPELACGVDRQALEADL